MVMKASVTGAELVAQESWPCRDEGEGRARDGGQEGCRGQAEGDGFMTCTHGLGGPCYGGRCYGGRCYGGWCYGGRGDRHARPRRTVLRKTVLRKTVLRKTVLRRTVLRWMVQRWVGRLRKNPQITRNCGLAMGADFRLSTPARTRTTLKMPEENRMFFQLSPRRSPRRGPSPPKAYPSWLRFGRP
jgi:hypothetical protein